MMNMTVHQDVGGSFICKFGVGDSSEHVRTTAEVVRETENVGIPSGHGRQGSEVVHDDGDARAVGQVDV